MHLFASLARPKSTPVVWHLHDFYGLRPVVPLLLRPAQRGVVGAIAISEAVKRDTQRVLPRLPITTIANAIDTKRFAPGAGDGQWLDRLSDLPPAAPETLRIGLVATYARWKGQAVFLEAAAKVRELALPPPTRFFIIGGPVYHTAAQFGEAELRERAKSLGLAEHVGFVGFQQETADIYRALDVVVHASTQPEPFGLTIVEAMSCGRPVIVTQAGGAAEIMTAGSDALGVPPGDASALAEAMALMLSSKELRQKLGAAARETAVSRFDSERLGPQLTRFYQTALAGHHT